MRRLVWTLWGLVPGPLRGPARAAIAFGRRRRATSTPLPDGPPPELPESAIELDTLFGTLWFDGDDAKLTPWVRRHATWEADVIRLIGDTVRPGMTVADVGANVGFHTVVLAQLVGEGGRVHAFEPFPQTVDLLRANVWRHGCGNVLVHAQAVSDRAGTVHISPDPAGRSGAKLAPAGIEVRAVRLDDVLDAVPLGFLKVDVEGAEPLVLKGAVRLLEASTALVAIVEFRRETHLDGSTPEEVLELYASLGFRLGLLRADGRAQGASAAEVLEAAGATETLNLVLTRR